MMPKMSELSNNPNAVLSPGCKRTRVGVLHEVTLAPCKGGGCGQQGSGLCQLGRTPPSRLHTLATAGLGGTTGQIALGQA